MGEAYKHNEICLIEKFFQVVVKEKNIFILNLSWLCEFFVPRNISDLYEMVFACNCPGFIDFSSHKHSNLKKMSSILVCF